MFGFFKKLFCGAETDASGLPPAWSFSDAEPIGDTPEAWAAAPARFLNAWELAWADRQMSDDRT